MKKLILAAVLTGFAGVALAQTSGSTTSTTTTTTTISPAWRGEIKEYVVKEKRAPVPPPPGYSVTVGAPLPPTAELYSFPATAPYAKYRYSVIGDVAQPGIRLMTRRLSVTEAISEAGGILQTGDKRKVFVLRKQAKGNLMPIPVNVSAIYRGQAPDSIYLLPGDQVIVPGNSLKKWQTLSSFLPILSFAKIFTGGW